MAWIRTSLAFLAGGVAINVVGLELADGLRLGLAVTLNALGIASAAAAWTRWARAERALRRGAPLPSVGIALPVALLLIVVGVALLVGLA